jgi:hypothetical protein
MEQGGVGDSLVSLPGRNAEVGVTGVRAGLPAASRYILYGRAAIRAGYGSFA